LGGVPIGRSSVCHIGGATFSGRSSRKPQPSNRHFTGPRSSYKTPLFSSNLTAVLLRRRPSVSPKPLGLISAGPVQAGKPVETELVGEDSVTRLAYQPASAGFVNFGEVAVVDRHSRRRAASPEDRMHR